MVSNSEEANWSNLQKQLKTDRRRQLQKPANIKRTYEILAKKLRNQQQADSTVSSPRGQQRQKENAGSYLNRYNNQNQLQQQQHSYRGANNNQQRQQKKRAHFRDDSTDASARTPSDDAHQDQQLFEAEQNMILNSTSSLFNNNTNGGYYSPLSTPANYRNNKSNDPYGINPLPHIRSPFYSARDSFYPNLESWGISNSALYDDTIYLSRHSPFLPVYNSIAKSQKVPYLVVPSLDSQITYKPPSPIFNDTNFNSTIRLNYINPIPYTRQIQVSSNDLKSDEYIKNAQKVLYNKPTDNYDGEELFSTKFLEDLEYKPEPLPKAKKKKIPVTVIAKPQEHQHRKSPRTPPVKVKNEALALDIAESIYQREIEMVIRKLAESTFKEEFVSKLKLQKPIYESIYEPMLAKMIREIAYEVVDDYERKIKILQSQEIKKVAREQIVNNLMLDHMLDAVAQQGKPTNDTSDDVVKLLDTMSLEILLNCHGEVRKFKEKTLKNYPIKKFHLNSFINVALDILIAEISSSLEDDMKELDKIEKI